MSIVDFLHRYLGKPYSDCDCWDITKLFYKEVLGIDMSITTDYGIPGKDEAYREKISKVVEMNKCKFEEVETLEIGDIILFNILGVAAHVGVFIGDKKFVHSIREVGCVVESLSKWGGKVKGCYRWPK